MAIPAKATGYGNVNAAEVFKVTFSTALSSAPKYEAYDRSASFPATGALNTTNKKLFTGTAGNGNKPMLCLVDTSTAQPGANWKPAGATAGSANPNRLKGQTNYITATTTPGAGGAIKFNLVVEVPSDLTPADSAELDHDLLIRYTYAGAAPTLTWAFNEGAEGAPSYTTLTPGTHGLRHAKAGAAAPDYYMEIPASGVADSAEGWVTT